MRCHAYVLPSEHLRELESQILEQLGRSEREQLMYLLGEHDSAIELLSGEWRVLFAAATEYYQVVDNANRHARMVVGPDELADFVSLLRDPQRRNSWQPIAFGIEELIDTLPVGSDLAGVVFVEESDDWLWVEAAYEIQAMRPDVYALIESHAHALRNQGDLAALGRLCGDHAEVSVEFTPPRWKLFVEHLRAAAPEVESVIAGVLTSPADYTSIREALAMVADPAYQPSLDAWLRVQADQANYALCFRDITPGH